MATTGSNFVRIDNTTLSGSAVTTAPYVKAMQPDPAAATVRDSGGTVLDKMVFDLSAAGFAKNGCWYAELSGSTKKTLDLTDLTATGVTAYAGDTTFAKWNQLIIYNTGTQDLVINTGSSNGATLPLAGTSPTITVPAGKRLVIEAATAGVTVDGTHKTIDVTPTSGGKIAICVGGA